MQNKYLLRIGYILGSLLAILSFAGPLVTAVSAQNSGSSPLPADLNTIQHFVFIVKENRSFDHYFGLFPGANGASTGKISTGQVIPLGHSPDGLTRNLGYGWPNVTAAIDGGRMDKFDIEPHGNVDGDYLALSQLHQSDIPNYWAYASNFVLAQNAFPSIHGPSFGNHLYTVAAQSGGATGSLANATHWGCDATPGATAEVLNSEGISTLQFPCFEFPILGDNLDKSGISWEYYSAANSDWNSMDVINHIRNTALWNIKVAPDTQFVTDALAGNLPAVSWLVPQTGVSEHPGNSSCQGENWSVQQINAVMQGPDWNSTIIVLVWDDHGGFYDHVPPPQPDVFGFGPRVPWLIISPYAKQGYISNTLYEFSSFLKLVEERYGLPALTDRDAQANDMLDSIDFNQAPRPPMILSTHNCSPVSTTELNFAIGQPVGTTSPAKAIIIQNYSSDTDISISKILLTGADFAQSNSCPGVLKPHKLCTISVQFTPTATGPRTGKITVTDSDPTSPQTVNLTGMGTNVTLSPPLVSFGTRAIGTHSQALTATLRNQSNSGLTITGMEISGDYTQTNTCGGGLAAGASCTISAIFAPTSAGSRYGSLTITDSDAGSPHILNLTGVGTTVRLSPAQLAFPNQPLGAPSTPQPVTLTNQGSAPLTISGMSIIGGLGQPLNDYSQTNNCGGSLNAHASCTINVTFAPVATGQRVGTLLVNDSEGGTSPQTVAVTGTGTANPVPLVNQPLVPASAVPGGAGFTLTVNGAGFLPSSIVRWNITPLATTLISSSKLSATVPAANISKADTATITVASPGPGGGSSNIVFFVVSNPLSTVTMSEAQSAVGSSPAAVAAGDFDANGRLDLAIANQNDNTVGILMGRGDGTFNTRPTVATGQGPVAIAVGDFNSDRKLDLAIANSLDNTVSILLGTGNGSFVPAPSSAATGNRPSSIAVADFNKDGRLDLAVVNSLDNTVSILLGNGDGTFYEVSTPVVGSGGTSIAAGDFNGDNVTDLAIANRNDNTVSVLGGRGDGTFIRISSPATDAGPISLVMNDFDGDGKLDLAVANQTGHTVSILRGAGNGTFQPKVDYPVGTAPASIALGDFNGDGKTDLVVANSGANTVSVLLGNGNTTFQAKKDFPTGAGPDSVVAGDFNRDGKSDLAATNQSGNSVSVLLNTGH